MGTYHMLHRKGGLIGPDLSDIANPLKLSSIRDARTKAQHSVSTDGRHDAGALRNQDSFSLQLLPDEFQDLLAFLSRQRHVPVPRDEEVMQ